MPGTTLPPDPYEVLKNTLALKAEEIDRMLKQSAQRLAESKQLISRGKALMRLFLGWN
jgi:hypothetical protein